MGAKVIEKHLILDKNLGGPDSEFSLDVSEFKEMVKLIKDTELSLGEVNYTLLTMKQRVESFLDPFL